MRAEPARHDEPPVLPARRLPFLGLGIGRRDAPQFERRRPQAEAEHDARGLGCGVWPDMGADRGGPSPTETRPPTPILPPGVLPPFGHSWRKPAGHAWQPGAAVETPRRGVPARSSLG